MTEIVGRTQWTGCSCEERHGADKSCLRSQVVYSKQPKLGLTQEFCSASCAHAFGCMYVCLFVCLFVCLL